jgi:hypothetical protein
MSDIRADQYHRNYAFRVEFSPGPPADAVHGKWKSFKGGGIRFSETKAGTGQDKFKETSLGIGEWQDITLTGEVTPERKDMLQWYKDMVEKGGKEECFRDVALTFIDREGNDISTISWHECFLTSYSLCDLNSEEDDVNCIETIQICTGYSEDYL